jgi:hypothetical protein
MVQEALALCKSVESHGFHLPGDGRAGPLRVVGVGFTGACAGVLRPEDGAFASPVGGKPTRREMVYGSS